MPDSPDLNTAGSALHRATTEGFMPIRTAISFSLVTSLVATLASALTAADGPRLLKDIEPGTRNLILSFSDPYVANRPMTEANGLLFFTRMFIPYRRSFEVWRSDGTTSGTYALPLGGNRLWQQPVAVDAEVQWMMEDAGTIRLLASNGSAAGTREVFRFLQTDQRRPYLQAGFVACRGSAYFFTSGSAFGDGSWFQLWRSDGKTVQPIPDPPYSVVWLNATSSHLLVSAYSPDSANYLCSIDPVTGAKLTLTEPVINNGDVIFDPVRVGDLVFFVRASAEIPPQLWRTDGTLAGTFPLTAPGQVNDAFPGIDADGRLLFSAVDTTHGHEPWVSDGTVAGTRMIADLSPGPASSFPHTFMAAKGQAFFLAGNRPAGAAGGDRLWRTDGTAGGTRSCLEIPATSPLIGGFLQHAAIGGVLFFNGYDADHGMELWQCDGTPSGTRRISDINPGPASSDPRSITEAGGRLFMHAADASHGRELWVHDADRTPPSLTITSPVRPTAVVTSDRCRFTGTARDAVGVTRLTITLRGATTGQFEIRHEPRPDEAVSWDLTLGILPGVTEAMIGAEDETGNRRVLRRMLIARAAGASGRTMHVGFLDPTPMATGQHRLDGPAFPGATVYALDDDGSPANRLDYRLSGGAVREGAATANDDGTWTISGATLGEGASALDVTARDAEGTTGHARLELAVPRAAADSSSGGGGRCGGGSGIAALALLAIALGLRRRT